MSITGACVGCVQGTLGRFVPAFRQGDQVGVLVDMDAATLEYFVNQHLVARITSRLPPGPLYPAVGSHKLARKGTSFAAAFDVAFQLSQDGNVISYNDNLFDASTEI
jgi:hypothetical protein